MKISDQIVLDFQRPQRIGFDEAVLCAGKSVSQINTIMEETQTESLSILLTRLEPEVAAALSEEYRDQLNYDAVSRTGFFNGKRQSGEITTQVAIVAAGSSDMPVAAEAMRTLEYFGVSVTPFIDVGVAGLWRLTSNLEALQKFPVIITVAGMDGALPSVLGGLVPGVLVVVPTSTGYGASNAGQTALNAALASCAPGLCVVNIDNGYGAACAAYRVVNMLSKRFE